MKKKTALLCIVLLFPSIFACGYHLLGRGQFPGGISTLSISPPKNRTQEPELSRVFASAIHKEINSRKELEVVASHKADAVLKGIIISFTTRSVAYDREGRATEYRISMKLDLELIHREDGKMLWQGKNIEGHEEYQASTVVLVNERNKDRAIRKLAGDMAETVYFRMKEGF